ncbi:DUF4097 family beta strand repeat-containing protein [Streptomyces mirabilis]|uniref:DUF4097 family beta strand repeat-containing protein n=1 Tax=Streptomyces sp. NPDC005388 TaxID=3156717 RepID=UPI0033BE6D67
MSIDSRSLKKFVVCAVTVAAAAVVTTGCQESDGLGKSASSSSQSYDVTDKVTGVSVDNNGGNIEIVAGTGSAIKVTERLEYSDSKPKTEHSVSGGELALKGGDCGGSASKCSVDYRIEVPAGVKVDASTGGGNITGTGLGGTVVAKTSGGNIDVAFGTAPASVNADSEGGNVTVKLPKGSYAVDASTDGGNKKVDVPVNDGSANKVKAHSAGGDVTVRSA